MVGTRTAARWSAPLWTRTALVVVLLGGVLSGLAGCGRDKPQRVAAALNSAQRLVLSFAPCPGDTVDTVEIEQVTGGPDLVWSASAYPPATISSLIVFDATDGWDVISAALTGLQPGGGYDVEATVGGRIYTVGFTTAGLASGTPGQVAIDDGRFLKWTSQQDFTAAAAKFC